MDQRQFLRTRLAQIEAELSVKAKDSYFFQHCRALEVERYHIERKMFPGQRPVNPKME